MTEKKVSARSTKFFVSFALVVALGGALGLSADHFYGSSLLFRAPFSAAVSNATSTPTVPSEEPKVAHLPTPMPLKAVYMTQCVAGTPSFRAELVRLIEDTELNAVVIDIKDFSGGLAFPTKNPVLAPYVSTRCGAYDMREFIETLHRRGIYVIGRITVFQDPLYTSFHPELAVKKLSATTTVWRDYKGLSFIDVGARPFWDYIVEVGRESYALGFDELNFDYVRYPSDGPMQDVYYPWSGSRSKPEALEEFFAYLSKELRDRSHYSGQAGPVLSVDLFGMTMTNQNDLNIGQVLERALPYFDYVYPMVYPSHYPPGFNNWSDPNARPYDIVKHSLSAALVRMAATTTLVAALTHERLPAQAGIGTTTPALYRKPAYEREMLRPWLQSFDYPVHYTPAMVEAQIQATYDAGIDSWIFWDPANRYTSLRQVLLQRATSTP